MEPHGQAPLHTVSGWHRSRPCSGRRSVTAASVPLVSPRALSAGVKCQQRRCQGSGLPTGEAGGLVAMSSDSLDFGGVEKLYGQGVPRTIDQVSGNASC